MIRNLCFLIGYRYHNIYDECGEACPDRFLLFSKGVLPQLSKINFAKPYGRFSITLNHNKLIVIQNRSTECLHNRDGDTRAISITLIDKRGKHVLENVYYDYKASIPKPIDSTLSEIRRTMASEIKELISNEHREPTDFENSLNGRVINALSKLVFCECHREIKSAPNTIGIGENRQRIDILSDCALLVDEDELREATLRLRPSKTVLRHLYFPKLFKDIAVKD